MSSPAPRSALARDASGPTSDSAAGIPIAEVSTLLSIPMPTLRSWESRYAFPSSERTPGRHRRYSPSELHALRLLRDEIARGTRARTAAELVRSRLDTLEPEAVLITAILEACVLQDLVAVAAELDAAARTLGLGGTVDHVLFPALREIGRRWQLGQCDIDTERLTTEAARSWLEARTNALPPPTADAPVVLACGPSDRHTLALEALSMLLRQHGRASRKLGDRTSVRTIGTAVQASQAVGIVIVSHLRSSHLSAVQTLRAVSRLGPPVFYAGNAFGTARLRRNVPGTYLGGNLQGACDTILHQLTGGEP